MKFSLKLIESNSEIRRAILENLISELDIVIAKSLPTITKKIQTLVIASLKQEPEYTSLISGKLKAEFGIPDSSKVDAVVDALAQTLEVVANKLRPSTVGISGGFKLRMMESDTMSGVIYTDIASVIDDDGYTLPWLEWLLLQGNQIIVRNYTVRMGSNPYSRSGLAIMVHSDSSWRVPPEFAGTERNNWTTRAIDRIESEVYTIISETIQDNI
jgi:hypothetical protein